MLWCLKLIMACAALQPSKAWIGSLHPNLPKHMLITRKSKETQGKSQEIKGNSFVCFCLQCCVGGCKMKGLQTTTSPLYSCVAMPMTMHTHLCNAARMRYHTNQEITVSKLNQVSDNYCCRMLWNNHCIKHLFMCLLFFAEVTHIHENTDRLQKEIHISILTTSHRSPTLMIQTISNNQLLFVYRKVVWTID